MTPAQARAARALLKWGVRDTAERAGVTPNTVSRFEQDEGEPGREPRRGPKGPREETREAIRRVYETAGVIFIDQNGEGPGVRLRKRGSGDE